MTLLKNSLFSTILATFIFGSGTSYAASTNSVSYSNEDGFKSVFISGGYGALFGGAMGAATIPFMHKSMSQNFRTVAAGASLGFMVGSLYGIYNLTQQTKSNTYFNYDPPTDSTEDSIYYSMPPTIPTQGSMPQEPPRIGALFVGELSDVQLGIPYVWVGGGQMEVMVAQLTF